MCQFQASSLGSMIFHARFTKSAKLIRRCALQSLAAKPALSCIFLPLTCPHAYNADMGLDFTLSDLTKFAKVITETQKKPEYVTRIRVDSWMNAITGMGGSADKNSYTFDIPDVSLPQDMLINLQRFNGLARRIACLRVDDALRNGWKLAIAQDADLGEKIEHQGQELGIQKALRQCLIHMRSLRGGAIFPIINGGKQSPEELASPLDPKTIKSVDGLAVYSAQQLHAIGYYNHPLSKHYATPSAYRVIPVGFLNATNDLNETVTYGSVLAANNQMGATSNALRTTGIFPEIHESRLLVASGPVVDPRHRLSLLGWGDSVFDQIIVELKDVGGAFGNVAQALHEFSTVLLGIPGLLQILASGREAEVLKRLQMDKLAQSVSNQRIYDTGDGTGKGGEAVERSNIPFTGIFDVLTLFMSKLAGAAGYSVTKLFGQSPKGLGNEGDSDRENDEDATKTFQTDEVEPLLRKFYGMLLTANGATPDDWEIKFNPLTNLSAAQEAVRRKTIAETDQINVNLGIYSPEEARVSRYVGDGFCAEIQTNDVAFRKHQEKQGQQRAEIVGQQKSSTPQSPIGQKEPKDADKDR